MPHIELRIPPRFRRPYLGLLALLVASFALLIVGCADKGDDDVTPGGTGVEEATSTGGAGESGGGGSADAEIPPEIEDAAGTDWPTAHNGYDNTRRADDSPITSENIDSLGVAWSREVAAPPELAFGVLAANPVILDGVVYMQDLNSNVYALDLETGETVWTQPLDEFSEGPNGVAVGYGRVYASDRTTMYALDIETGEITWQRELVTSDTAGIDIQPVVFNGMVYTSTVPGTAEEFYAGGDAGVITALDAETGEVAWEFETIASDDLWGNAEVNSGGGSWFPAAVDPDTGVTYWAVANPAPFPGTEEFPSGSSRPGPNLYTNSLVALDGETGEMLWHHQVRPHDLFDHDLQISPILAEVTLGSEETGTEDVPIAITAGKMGVVYGFDRESGDLLWSNPVGTHMNDLRDRLPAPGEERLEVWPGPIGGVETPMAYADGVVYEVNLQVQSFWDGVDYEMDLGTGTGQLYAIDAATGKTLWSTNLDSGLALGGVTVVNDLVLTATNDGTMYAFNRETGEEVWSMQAPAGINAQPAVSGDTIIWPAGVPSGDSGPLIYALRLDADGDFAPPEGAEVLGQAAFDTPPSGEAAPEGGEQGAEDQGEDQGAEDSEGPADAGTGPAVEVELSAENIAFSRNEISVPAGAQVTMTFTNNDAVGHDFDLWESSSKQDQLFDGEIITGPGQTTTYEFTAPEEPGEYFFDCSVHPQQMTGTFIVTPG